MHFVKLRIAGEDLPFEEIEYRVAMTSRIKYRKGDVREYRGNSIEYTEDCIVFEKEICSDSSINESISDFIESLFKEEFWIKLSAIDSIKLWISVYPETEQLNFTLSSEDMRIIAASGVDLCISVMCLQQFYDGQFRNRIGDGNCTGDG